MLCGLCDLCVQRDSFTSSLASHAIESRLVRAETGRKTRCFLGGLPTAGAARRTACHNRSMGVISQADQDKIREAVNEMTSPLRLLFFSPTLNRETCPPTPEDL